MFLELTFRFFRRIATLPFFIFLLLVVITGSVAYGLSQMIRGLEFGSLYWLAFLGLSLGWLLARTRIKIWLASLLIFLSGIFGTFIWVGNLLSPLVNLIRTLIIFGWVYIRQQDRSEILTSLQLVTTEFSVAITSVWIDLQDWMGSLTSDNPTFRFTAVFLIWGLGIWFVSGWAGWVQKRQGNAVYSILPGCLLLTITMGYTWADISILLPLMFSAMLLIALTWLNSNEIHWEKSGIDYPLDARVDTIMSTLGISILLIALAFFLPRLSIRKMIESVSAWTNPQVEQVAPIFESFGIEPYRPSIGKFGPMLDAGLPRAHLIGSGPELSEQVIMSVQITGGLPPGTEAEAVIPLYWRGLTYDRYTGSGWDSSDVSLRKYKADEQIGIFERPGYWIIEQEVRFVDESELLFSAGDLISVDEKYQVAWRTVPVSSDIEANPGDIFGASVEGLNYRAQSFVPVPDEITLRASSFFYPDWIRENYILVPIDTPQRVIQHTLDLIEDVHNPYDRAKIIEQYLRQFEYTTDLPAPPQDHDIVDYFLFDLKKGYCDYFATAMVVMARSAYLPARLVVGYSRGTYDAVNDRYVVTEADAHSWPEIYFEGIGWVPFEPTSGRKEIERSAEPLEFPGDIAYVMEVDSLLGGLKPLFGSWPLTFGIAALGLVWAWMIWITLDEWLLKRHSPARMAAKLYERLYRHGRRLGSPAQKEDTPYEFAEILREQILSLPFRSIARKSMHQAGQAVENLTDIYIRSQYSPEQLSESEKERTLAVWQRLRRKLILARGLRWLRKLKPRNSADPEPEILE